MERNNLCMEMERNNVWRTVYELCMEMERNNGKKT